MPGPPVDNPYHPLWKWSIAHGIKTVSELAAKLDIKRSSLSQILSRRHRPSAPVAWKLMKETGLGLEELLEPTAAEIRAGVKATYGKAKRRRRK